MTAHRQRKGPAAGRLDLPHHLVAAERPERKRTFGHGAAPLHVGRWAAVQHEARDTRNDDWPPRSLLRLMLVDDHEVVRSGLKTMLEAAGDVRVVAEAGTVRDAIVQAERTKPDVVVMDVRLADGSGIEATREIRAQRPETKVLMLTSFADDEALFASIMAGASGYVLKQIRGDDLVRAIRSVGQGQSLLDPAITATVLDRLRKGKHLLRDERLARLSAQEERILTLVAEGHTNREIGSRLKLAEKTVKN